MADPLLTIGFDASSLGIISTFPRFNTMLNAEIGNTLYDVGEMLAQDMTTKTWEVFAYPEGHLADAIEPNLVTPLELRIDVNVPYAWRMEMGFVGADSMGRVYNQEGKPYAQPTLDDDAEKIAEMMSLAAGRAVAQFSQGPRPR